MTSKLNKLSSIDGPRITLFLCALALILIGLVMVYSASVGQVVSEGEGNTDSSSFLIKQAAFAAAGIITGLFVWKFATPTFLRSAPVAIGLIALTWALLIATSIYGVATNGAQRWITIGSTFTLQPSEFVKISLVILACKFFSDYMEGTSSLITFLIYMTLGVFAPLVFMFVAQSDLGSAMIIGVGLLCVLWVGGAPGKWVVGIIVLAVCAILASIFLTPYRSGRMYFMDPWSDGENGAGNGFQLIRSFYAFSQGGLIGAGVGNSTEKLTPLPEAETDFIFAIIGEEMGLAGALCIIAIFFAFLVAGLHVARTAEDPFSAMLAGALSAMLVFQAFLNMACVIGVAPTTGKPLPFISSGGSSMLASVWIVALILAARPAGSGGSIYDARRENLRVVRSDKVVHVRR